MRTGKKLPRVFNAGTWTKADFWSFIRSALRNRSRFWKPIYQAKNRARRQYKGKNKRQKWEYQCASCKKWYMDKYISVDHIQPLGILRDYSDLPHFVKTLFCEADNLQVLCKTCHKKKTNKERDGRKAKINNSRSRVKHSRNSKGKQPKKGQKGKAGGINKLPPETQAL